MDILRQAALSYQKILGCEYVFRLGTKSRTMIISLISSTKGEFIHTVGLHHLQDVARLQTTRTYEKELIFKDICKGKLTWQYLSEISQMIQDPISGSINPRTGNLITTEDRILALQDLSIVLDMAYKGNIYKWNKNSARIYTKEGKHRASTIKADYMLAVPTDIKGENIYIFLRRDYDHEDTADENSPIRLSIFSAFPDTAELHNGQQRFTILEEARIEKNSTKEEQLYILPSYKAQIEPKPQTQSDNDVRCSDTELTEVFIDFEQTTLK